MAFQYYRICRSVLDLDVEKRVNELMQDGWLPLGDLIALPHEDDQTGRQVDFIQVMVKPPSRSKPKVAAARTAARTRKVSSSVRAMPVDEKTLFAPSRKKKQKR